MFAVVDTWACPSRLEMLTLSTPLKYSIEAIVLIPNVNSDVTLGRYVAVAGQIQGDPRFPEAAWPYLDFAKIGAEYYAEHGGAYTHAGYVLRKQDMEPVREKEAQIHLELISSQAQASAYLPATKEELEQVKRILRIESFAEAAITKVSFASPYMDEYVPIAGACVEDANELAWAIEGIRLEDGELMKYLSVLSVEQPETMQDALHYAMNLDNYERITEDTYEYGQTVLRRIGADDELIDTIDGYMDLWFAHRFGEEGTVYEAQIKKEHIHAYFSGRNESEVIVDPMYLEQITEAPEPQFDMQMT